MIPRQNPALSAKLPRLSRERWSEIKSEFLDNPGVDLTGLSYETRKDATYPKYVTLQARAKRESWLALRELRNMQDDPEAQLGLRASKDRTNLELDEELETLLEMKAKTVRDIKLAQTATSFYAQAIGGMLEAVKEFTPEILSSMARRSPEKFLAMMETLLTIQIKAADHERKTMLAYEGVSLESGESVEVNLTIQQLHAQSPEDKREVLEQYLNRLKSAAPSD